MTLSDPRFISLNQWLNHYFSAAVTPKLISGDASFRRYFRVSYNKMSFIVADSPPDLVPIAPFISLSHAYNTAGLVVPEVIAFDCELGFMLLSDLGDTQLLSLLTLDNVQDYYRQALDLLPSIAHVQQVPMFDGISRTGISNTQMAPLPRYDNAFVQRELAIFVQWLVGVHLQLTLTADEQAMLAQSFAVLVDNALSQPSVGMHRDFHSRNIMLQQHKLCVIDFQDAVIGPVTYDAVSLLRDCYIRWPQNMVTSLMQYHYQLALTQGFIPQSTEFSQYTTWFDLMGLQRHIKAAGIFARLKHRDNKPAYMADIPLTLGYIVDIASQYADLAPFSQWVTARILPAFSVKQSATDLLHSTDNPQEQPS